MNYSELSNEQPITSIAKESAIPAWLLNPAGVVLIISAVFGIFGTLTLAIEIGQPFAGYMTYGYFEHPHSELSHETPRWWEPIADGNLIYGDKILSINGLPYAPFAETALKKALGEGKPVQLLVERLEDQSIITTTLPVMQFTFWEFLDVKLPEILVGVVFWMLAAIVLRADPESVTNRVFATVAALVALHRLTAVTSIATHTEILVNSPKLGHMVAAGLIGPLLFHLAFLFPTPVQRPPRVILVILYAVGVISGVGMALSRFPIWNSLPPDQAVRLGTFLYQVMLFLLLGGIIALFSRLIWSWSHWKTVSRRERRVVKIVLVGLLISLPPVIVVLGPIIPFIGYTRTTFWQGLDVRYFMLAIPVAFALAIVRYHTFRGPSPQFLLVVAVSISALLAAVGVAVLQTVYPEYWTQTRRSPFVIFFACILLASLFWSRQTDWRGWFGRYLNRADRNYESVRSFGWRVMGRNDLRLLPGIIAQALVDELELAHSAVWLWDAPTGSYQLVATAGGKEARPDERIYGLKTLPGRAMQVAWPTTPSWLKEPAKRGKLEALVPLVTEDRTIGLLGLGQRWDEEIFDERDLAVAELVGQQATLFLLAAIQVEELRRVPARVAEAQERERNRLASELHDTIQQFLGRLPFFMAVSQDLIETNGLEAVKLLDRCMNDVEDASRVLREIRANLAPNQLVVSLEKPLDGLVNHVQRRAGLRVYLDIPDYLDESTNLGTRHALYRVIQQALDNAVAHAEASEVMVRLRRDNGRVVFSVTDNGRGSTEMALRSAQSSGGFGLQSMRARLETVGGEFSFDSAVGQGTTVSGWVPAASYDSDNLN